jgi:hypothetical protein
MSSVSLVSGPRAGVKGTQTTEHRRDQCVRTILKGTETRIGPEGSRTTVGVTRPTRTCEQDRRGRPFDRSAFVPYAEPVTRRRREAWLSPAPDSAAAPCNGSRRHRAPNRDADVRRRGRGSGIPSGRSSRTARRRRWLEGAETRIGARDQIFLRVRLRCSPSEITTGQSTLSSVPDTVS